MEQFTTLARLKSFLSVSTTESDDLLTALIQQVTSQILAYLSRDTFLRVTDSLVINGRGTQSITFPEWPVLAVSSVSVDGRTIGAGNVAQPAVPGFRFDGFNGRPPGQPQKLYLTGYTFTKGLQNVAVTYQHGYAVTDEQKTPAASVTPAQQYGKWAQDDGVKDATGAAMTKVSATPAVGQYTVSDVGAYGFNASEPGPVFLSYSYVPAAIEKACIDLCARRYRERSRIGQRTQSQGGEVSNSYDLAAMPEDAKILLNSYKKVFQPC